MYNEILKLNSTDQIVNRSFCCISGLEVYQGRKQVIEISHQGFSLSNNGNVKVLIGLYTSCCRVAVSLDNVCILKINYYTDLLGYDLEAYVGELYHMNLSCSGGGLPESGCLFFKVRGQSYVTKYGYRTIII